MHFNTVDYLVIVAYISILVSIGFILRKRSSQSKNDYLLGGKKLPWWMLGISNASGMFDISGTIWMVTIMFVYGVKSIWLPWLWPVFNQVFLFVYLSIWLRRSNASTGAEWMLTRFGTGKDAQKSHSIIVVFALLSCLGFMAYGFIGLGKFVEIFIPFENIQPFLPFTVSSEFVPHFYGIAFTLIAVFYSIMGGMSSIVWADVVQYTIMAIGAVTIAVVAITHLSGQELHVPEGWRQLRFGLSMNLDWGGIIPEVNHKIKEDGFEPFSIFFSLMFAKGILASLAGPAPTYDMQKVLSSKSPREAALMSMFVNIVLLPTRYLMIIGFTILALLYYNDLNLMTAAGELDFERILPSAIVKFAPAGLMGLFLVELISAFMGTFAGTLNASQAYLVNDIYLKSINKKASNRQIANMNYLAGISIVVISIGLGIFSKDVNSVLQWMVGALFGAYVAPNVLKWYWWRFNGAGFFYGMLFGIAGALAFPYLFPETVALYYFPLILLISALGCVIGSLRTPPTDMAVLKEFYSTVRPWGFWNPVLEEVKKDNPDFEPNKDFKKDMFNVLVGIIGQTGITVLPVFIVLLMPAQGVLTALVVAAAVFILYKNWYKKLPER